MKRQGVHRKLRDETAEQDAVITEVTCPQVTGVCETHPHPHRNCTWRGGPRTEPQEPQHSKSKRRRQLTEPREEPKGRARASKEAAGQPPRSHILGSDPVSTTY